jgi:hypothetical protein
MRGKHILGRFFLGGVCMPEGFVRLRGQVNHEHKIPHTFKKHTRQLQTLSRIHKANNNQLQKSHEVLQAPTMPNNSRCLGLVLFILGSWLAIVVDVFILLDSRFSRNLMAVGGEVAVLLSHWCWLGKCRFASLLISHHMVVRSSEGLLKCAIGGILARQT